MRNERKYLALSVLSFLVIGLFLVTCIREPWRMPAKAAQQDHEWIALGAKIYAENCIQCHGPKGEGVVGMPLNRPDLKGHPQDSKHKETYEYIYRAVANGRPGTNTPLWVKANGQWISYTRMPAWGKEAGGPLDENMVRAVTYFIMMGDQKVDPADENSLSFWDSIGSEKFPPQPATTDEKLKLPKAKGLTDAENQAAQELIEKGLPAKGAPSCLACHMIGPKGGKIGPDLTAVGAWGLDADFLKRWISDPPGMPNDQRMPVYWSKHRIDTGPNPSLKDPVVSDIKSQMPPFKDKLSPAELDLLVRYLLGLRPD